METPKEMRARVRSMASGNLTWDLSANDIAALQRILAEHDSLATYLAENEDIAERKDGTLYWIGSGEDVAQK